MAVAVRNHWINISINSLIILITMLNTYHHLEWVKQRVNMGFHRERGFMVPGNKSVQPSSHGNKIAKIVGERGCFLFLG
jgi:hypothetical protein